MVTRRLNRIFKPDGRAFVAACDHGMINGPMRGIERLGGTLEKIINGGVDAIMASYGTAVRFPKLLSRVGLVLRMDGAASPLAPSSGPGQIFYRIEDALRLGADALCVTTFPGTEDEEHTLEGLSRVIREAHEWGIPVMAEMMPGGFGGGAEFRTAEAVGTAARVAAELGADWVKVPHSDDFARVVESCYVPVVVLGGEAQDHPRSTVEMVRAGMDAGASGATIGRNIWQSADPEGVTAAIAGLIHEDLDIQSALARVKG